MLQQRFRLIDREDFWILIVNVRPVNSFSNVVFAPAVFDCVIVALRNLRQKIYTDARSPIVIRNPILDVIKREISQLQPAKVGSKGV